MADFAATHPGAGLVCDTNINSAAASAHAAGTGNRVILTNNTTNGISSTWTLDAANGDVNASNANAQGAVEMGSSVLVLEPGVTVREKLNSFAGTHQPAFRWSSRVTAGVTFGAGSSIYGRREDHAADIGSTEYRAALKFLDCNGVTITGSNETNIKNWFGDGIWLGSSTIHNLNTTITNVGINDNHRHAITLEDVSACTVRGCFGTGNDGTNSSRGICIEPDNATDLLANVLVENCRFESHAGGAIGVLLESLDGTSAAISIVLRNNSSLKSADPTDEPWGFDFKMRTGGPSTNGGTIDCYDLKAINLKYAGFRFHWRPDTPVRLRMRGCVAERCSAGNLDNPFDFNIIGTTMTGNGIQFFDCYAIEDKDRKVTRVAEWTDTNENVAGTTPITNITGNIRVQSLYSPGTHQGQTLFPRLNFERFGRPRFSNKAKARRSANRGAV